MDLPLPLTVVIICILLNVLSFAGFVHDKMQAKARMKRYPELFLLLLAALGPAGALAAMLIARHKTRRVKFLLVPVFLIIHLFLFNRLWPLAFG